MLLGCTLGQRLSHIYIGVQKFGKILEDDGEFVDGNINQVMLQHKQLTERSVLGSKFKIQNLKRKYIPKCISSKKKHLQSEQY